jgi:hypothetical protein
LGPEYRRYLFLEELACLSKIFEGGAFALLFNHESELCRECEEFEGYVFNFEDFGWLFV